MIGKEYQWRLIYADEHIHEFVGTTHDMTNAVAKQWLVDKQQPMQILFREDVNKAFEKLEVVEYIGNGK